MIGDVTLGTGLALLPPLPSDAVGRDGAQRGGGGFVW